MSFNAIRENKILAKISEFYSTTEQCHIIPGVVGSRVDVVVDSVTVLSPR